MSKILIAGCGFVGAVLAQLLTQAGEEVVGINPSGNLRPQLTIGGHPSCGLSSHPASLENVQERSPSLKLSELSYTLAAADLNSPESLTAISLKYGPFDKVIHCASSHGGDVQAYQQLYLEGLSHLIQIFAPQRLIFTSSTSVYAQNQGEWVDETSPCLPLHERGQILLQAEQLALASGGWVARFVGIYGPGRSHLLQKFLDGTAWIEGDGQRWINQIHRDDAAQALKHLVSSPSASGIYNFSDGHPLTQRELYQGLAQFYHRPLPPLGPSDLPRTRGNSNKRVSHAKALSLGWTPQFSSYFEALPGL